jgi:hypothetical protein
VNDEQASNPHVLADGWLPTLPGMEPGGLARGNAIIDVAEQGHKSENLRDGH